MNIYSFIVAVLVIFQFGALLFEINHKSTYFSSKYKSVQLGPTIYWPIAIFILGIAAFRNGVGYDFWAYENLFSNIRGSSSSIFDIAQKYNYELGYVWLNKILTDFQSLIFIMAVLGVGIKLYYIYKYSDCRVLTLIMYFTGIFFTFDMGVIRQGVAIAFFFCVLHCCEKDKKIWALIIIILSSFFHISSLIYLPIIFIGNHKFSRKQIYLITLIVSTFIFFDISGQIVNLLSFLNINVLTSKVDYYATIETGNILISYLKRVVFLVIFTEFYQKYDFKNKIEVLMFNSYFFGIILMAMFSSIDILGGRGVTAYYFAQTFIFASMYKRTKSSFWKAAITVVCIALSLYAMYNTISYGDVSGQNYTPYKTIWG